MNTIEVRTQTELDAALAKVGPNDIIACVGNGYFEVRDSSTVSASGSSTVYASGSSTVSAYDSSTVRAYGSSTVYAYDSSTVRASGSSTVSAYDSSTVRAYDSSTVSAYDSSTVSAYDSSTVYAYDSSTVSASGSSTVSAYGSSTVSAYDSSTVSAYGSSTVYASGSSTVSAYDSSTVSAAPYVHILAARDMAQIEGGIRIDLFTPAEWCAYHGTDTHDDGRTILYKAVGPDWRSGHLMSYEIGTTVEAPDWEPTTECGHGLHLVARPVDALQYFPDPAHYLACAVVADDLVLIDSGKVKVRTLEVLYEVDEHGQRLQIEVATS